MVLDGRIGIVQLILIQQHILKMDNLSEMETGDEVKKPYARYDHVAVRLPDNIVLLAKTVHARGKHLCYQMRSDTV